MSSSRSLLEMAHTCSVDTGESDLFLRYAEVEALVEISGSLTKIVEILSSGSMSPYPNVREYFNHSEGVPIV